MTKGDKIYCEGRIKTRQWSGDDGQMRYMTEIHVRELTFLTNKKEEAQNQNPTSEPQTPKTDTKPSQEFENGKKDDLPF